MGTGKTLHMLSKDVIGSYRHTSKRIFRHPIMTAWFMVLLIVGFSTVLVMAEYVSTLDIEFLLIKRGDILFVIFFFFMGKASSETMDSCYRNNSLKHLFSSPVKVSEIRNMVFLKILWYNLLLLAISVSLMAGLYHILNIDLYIDGYFFLHIYLVVIAALLVGFNIATLSNINNKILKYMSIGIYGQNISLVYLTTQGHVDHWVISLYLLCLIVLSFVVFLSPASMFTDAWIKSVSGSKTYSTRSFRPIKLFRRCSSKPFCRVAEKEMLERWRRKETTAVLGIVAIISVGLVILYHQLGPEPDLGLGIDEYFYPVFIGMSVFLVVSLQILIPSLTLFSRDGKRMWAIKILPVPSREIVYGKLLSLLIFTPVIPIFIVTPLMILLDYPFAHLIFVLISSVTLIFLSSGIGIWAAARFPNFDEGVDGAPDVMTMYIVLMMCLIIGSLFIVAPLLLLTKDSVLGVLFAILSADIAALSMFLLCKRATYIYDGMELDM